MRKFSATYFNEPKLYCSFIHIQMISECRKSFTKKKPINSDFGNSFVVSKVGLFRRIKKEDFIL